MKVPTGRLLLAASLILFGSSLSFAGAPSAEAVIHDSPSQITGTWRGNSECVLKNSPCRDEINVYRFSEIAGKRGWFCGIGSKLVDGKEVSRPVCHPFVCLYRRLHHRHSHCITSTL